MKNRRVIQMKIFVFVGGILTNLFLHFFFHLEEEYLLIRKPYRWNNIYREAEESYNNEGDTWTARWQRTKMVWCRKESSFTLFCFETLCQMRPAGLTSKPISLSLGKHCTTFAKYNQRRMRSTTYIAIRKNEVVYRSRDWMLSTKGFLRVNPSGKHILKKYIPQCCKTCT